MKNKYEKLLNKLRQHTPHASVTMDQVRLDFEEFYLSFQKRTNITVEKTILIGDIPAYWIRYPDSNVQRCILFLHGGGFTIGSTKDHLDLCSRLSQASGSQILSVDYRLAPEHPFPASLYDCLIAYTTLLGKYDPSQIIVSGISAGGNLALSLILLLKKENLPLPGGIVALSPAVNLLFKGESVSSNALNDWILPERLKNVRESYLIDKDPKNPLASPVFGDLTGFPPLLIQVGKHELLLDDIRQFALKFEQQGNILEYQEWDNMFHCWQIFAEVVSEGREAIRSIGEFIQNIWIS